MIVGDFIIQRYHEKNEFSTDLAIYPVISFFSVIAGRSARYGKQSFLNGFPNWSLGTCD
jgi:hypothetical protein